MSTLHACNTTNWVMGSLIFLTFNWAELKSANGLCFSFTAIILPATITPRPVENKANYLHESVQNYSHPTTGIRSKLTLDKLKGSETMDSQQKTINHKRPTLKSKANFQLRSDVWETNEEIPYWWCITILNYEVLLMGWKFASCNQKHYTTHILRERTTESVQNSVILSFL